MERISKCDSWAILSSPFWIAFHEVASCNSWGAGIPRAGHGSCVENRGRSWKHGQIWIESRAPGRPRWKTFLHLYWLMTKVLCYLCCYVWQVHISHLHSWFLFLTPKVMIFSRTGTCEVSSGSDQTLASLAFLFIFLHFRPIFVPRLR